MADDLGTVLAVPVDHDPWAVPKPGQTVPQPQDPIMALREAAGNVVQQARPYWMDLEPTDQEIAQRQSAMQTGQTQPGKVLPTTGMNPVPFAMLDAASMLPAGGLAKFASGLLGIGAKRALGAAAEAGAGAAERGVAGAAAEAAPAGIRAYHSSPHDFTQFDLSKIGTGEGAQSYGHGIYVAENPAVSGQGGEYWRSFARQLHSQAKSPEMAHAIQILEGTGGDRAAALAKIDEVLRSNTPTAYPREQMQATRDLLASDKQVGPRTYEVNIGARPEQFLDWDKPLSEQHPKVREQISNKLPNMPDVATGAQVYDALKNRAMSRLDPSERQMPRAYQPDASQVLNEAGIPGIRYLDQGSRRLSDADIHDEIAQIMKDEETARKYGQRAAPRALGPTKANEVIERLRSQLGQQQTSNYVVFDPKMIEIMRKYGIIGAAGVPAYGAMQQQYPLPFQPEAQ